MATVCLGASLAEAYAVRSLHKQKMKKMEEQEATKSDDNVFDEMKMPAAAGCFSFWVSKKTHSAKLPPFGQRFGYLYCELDKDLSEYTPSLSSSSKNLSCSHRLCESSLYCKVQRTNNPCLYIIEYDSDNTSRSGYLEDKLHLKSFLGHAEESSIQASVIIGCGRKQSGGYLDGAAPDGPMGLGPGNVSIPSLLTKAGLIQNSFSICLDETGSGRNYFGEKELPSQQSTPFLPIGGNYSSSSSRKGFPKAFFGFSTANSHPALPIHFIPISTAN
ncbi:hypothetical protein V6N13_012144 [Hibiscus sabdariffa]